MAMAGTAYSTGSIRRPVGAGGTPANQSTISNVRGRMNRGVWGQTSSSQHKGQGRVTTGMRFDSEEAKRQYYINRANSQDASAQLASGRIGSTGSIKSYSGNTAGSASAKKGETINPYGSSSGNILNRVINEQKKAYNEAKAANEQRYSDILKGYEDRYSTALNTLEGAGKQESADIKQQYKELAAEGSQGLVNSGLYNTTIAPTMAMGYAKQEAGAQNRLNESLRQQKLNLQTGLSQDKLSFMERREDTYPDYSSFLNLMQQGGYGTSTNIGDGSSGYSGGTGYSNSGQRQSFKVRGSTSGSQGIRRNPNLRYSPTQGFTSSNVGFIGGNNYAGTSSGKPFATISSSNNFPTSNSSGGYSMRTPYGNISTQKSSPKPSSNQSSSVFGRIKN